ncbi:hypothetical protein F4X88_06685 [Candidatus Poribacteria bacterium]|nr:hypothetical protein [Candidatus Poribacteria bacterium]
MKDKIVYLIIGMLTATIIMLIAGKTDNLTAEGLNITPQNTTAFDNVVIKGTLVVGEGKNQIFLHNDKDGSHVIISSQDSVISITAHPEKSNILITPDIYDSRQHGINLITGRIDPKSNRDTFIRIKDVKGQNTIGSQD